MRWIKYSRYIAEELGIDTEDLMRALSDFLLESGYHRQFFRFAEWNDQSLEGLQEAIRQALESGELFDPEDAERLRKQLENLTPEQMEKMLTPGWSGTVLRIDCRCDP